MSEMKPTPGEWFCGDWIPADHNTAGWVEVWTVDAEGNRSLPFVSCKHFDAGDNARLIAEAGTVFHNTGLSPVQLVEMVKELKAALNLWLGTADNPNAGWRGAGGSDVLFACEHCGKKHEDCTRLEHACDCPITLARAALAKCEGVKP